MASVKAAKEIVDPLTFQPLRIGSVVDLKSDNGVTMKFKIVRIEDDESLVLQRPDAKVIAYIGVSEVIVNREMIVGKFGVRSGDNIVVKYKDGSTQLFHVDLVLNNDLLVISKPGRKKMGYLSRLKMLWQLRNLK